MAKDMDRRRFLKTVGVTGTGAAALAGCGTDTAEKLIPYLVPPENQIPGIATYYASTCRECSAGCGVHVKTREGRAIKMEGNPDNPISGGGLCARGQAALQGLYNPDRVRSPMVADGNGGFTEISWDDALAQVAERLGAAGADPWFLSGNETGSFSRLIGEWLNAYGGGSHVSFESFGYEALRHAGQAVFGADVVPHYDFAASNYVISFGTDFLETFQSPVEYARTFTEGHSFHDGHMGRYVHVEPRMSMTGMNADEWVAPNPGTEALVALAMANVVLAGGGAPNDAGRLSALLSDYTPDAVAGQCGIDAETITRLANEFAAGDSAAVGGGMGAQHGLAHNTAAAVNILNYVAGNVGTRVTYHAAAGAGSYQGLRDLVSAMQNGDVGVLFMHGANPAYNAPAGSGFADAVGQVGYKVSFARVMDETSALADLILPDHDPLEQWNDFEPREGIYALQQPVMSPVFDTRQTGDVLISLASTAGVGSFPATYKDYLQARWGQLQRQLGVGGSFDDFWNASLMAGGRYTSSSGTSVRLVAGAATLAFQAAPAELDGMTLIAYPSPIMHDGRGANRPWLQELPDPVSKITWSSWVEIHPETADEMGVADGDFLSLETPNGTIEAPAWRYPGIRRDTIAVPTGQGHTSYGQYAAGVGANVYAVLNPDVTEYGGVSHYARVTVTKTGAHEKLATNAGSPRQMGRGIAQSTTLHDIEEGHFHTFHIAHAAEVPEELHEVVEEWQHMQDEERARGNYAPERNNPRWGLSIDLSKCTGCSACVTACYAENNLPTLGKLGVQRGREMSWLRIERYFEGGENGEPLKVEVLPMMCQQCGRAPCEPVCPVFAAYHTSDGLNGQVYNRCVGTRYCANNCPYKVRYFNWWDHGNPADPAFSWPEPMQLLLNPDVVVRSKGVMEKCTFCVQRIRDTQNTAAVEGREIADGEIQTACQQSCPSHAIVFGNLKDAEAEVSQQFEDELGYRVLEGLNTDPGVNYLTRVRNTVEA